MHVELDLPGYEDKDKKGKPTGIALPYVVTIEKGTGVDPIYPSQLARGR
jgi:hypothetical protein